MVVLSTQKIKILWSSWHMICFLIINYSMKKSIIRTNIIIALMFVALIGLSYSNARALYTQADSRVFYSGNQSNSNVSFMINVYQGNEYVKSLLDIFDVYNVKATFFVGGSWAVKNLDLVKEIYTRGHELGNHGFYHKDQDTLDFDSNVQEISMCHKVISENLGVEMSLFAPPSGAYNITTVDAAVSLNYKTIMWTHDTIDWKDQDEKLIYKRATKDLSNGDLILMHPTKKTVEAMTDILSYAINNGFNPTTVSNCISG